ncbi:MAG: GNAT family N-acetyltransferase [Gammaproteobacteria bacterium]|nr:GNAT family N-acetyltransferase [Gammaproteobacteria bacterium]
MKIISPKTDEEFEKYFELRWRMLRAPWNEPRGSEKDIDECNSFHLMAIENKDVIAVARLQFINKNQAQLRYMAVDDSQQNKGIGKRLLQQMENYSIQQQANEIFLHARENAVGFYEKRGYKFIEKSYLLFDSIQHYKMSKKL